MPDLINWGIIGPGHIAEKFASDLQYATGAQLYAAASRDIERARDFASRFNAPQAYGSYEDIVTDRNVDIIYIATPHPAHFANTMLCLEHGKAVLCEKPFAINARQAVQMVEMAGKKNVFLMEAMWTRFNPVIRRVYDLVQEGTLGQVKHLRADFGFKSNAGNEGRVFNPELGGGSLLDVGVYPLFLSQLLLGKPVEIHAVASLNELGTDNSCAMVCRHTGNALSLVSSSVVTATGQTANIDSDHGRIEIPQHWYRPKKAVVFQNDLPEREIMEDFEGWGYQFEAMEAMRCLEEHLLESPLLPHAFSLDLMKTMDEVREQCGIIYPADLS